MAIISSLENMLGKNGVSNYMPVLLTGPDRGRPASRRFAGPANYVATAILGRDLGWLRILAILTQLGSGTLILADQAAVTSDTCGQDSTAVTLL
jgi:hypothetical protein